MIENERQYNITRAQLRRLEQTLERAKASGPGADVNPLLQRAQAAGLASQVEDLRRELRDYEDLRSGATSAISLTSLGNLPETLIKARVAAGMTQRALGEALGLKEQQVQRYETTRYAGASLRRVLEVASALGLSLLAPAMLAVRGPRAKYRVAGSDSALKVAEERAGVVLESPSSGEGDSPNGR